MTATVQQYLENYVKEHEVFYNYYNFIEEAPFEVKQYIEELEDDIIKMAIKDRVYVLDINSEMAEGYEVDTLEQYLSYCSLPETVKEFAEISKCDYDFLIDLFISAEDRNEAAAFQLASGTTYINYTSAYRTMTSNYEIFKRIMKSDIYILDECDKQVRELIYKGDLHVLGNELGEKFFDIFVENLEKKYNTEVTEELAELYKKSVRKEVEKNSVIGIDNIFDNRINYKEIYDFNKRDLIVDIVEHVENKGISISNECMPENMIKFKELSGCTEEEIIDIYKIAAEKAEDYKIAYIQYGEKVVLLKNYEEVSKFIDSCGMDLEDLEIGAESNSFAYARIIKCLAEKSEKTADDYWNEMMDILFSMSEENEDVEEAVKYVLTTPAGIAYTALKKDLHYKYRYYSRDAWSIKEELKQAYMRMNR